MVFRSLVLRIYILIIYKKEKKILKIKEEEEEN